MAVHELGMDYQEFLRKSLRQISILIHLNRKHRLGILFEVANAILSESSQEEKDEIIEVDSFTEIF